MKIIITQFVLFFRKQVKTMLKWLLILTYISSILYRAFKFSKTPGSCK